ncbi:uncharacterized protein LOC106011367 [Aplysia californica]|uniref:Uncharacterized protein LOC106011367 n=1 Tax=Aplysia californica TaxID=6500 RepID=A0ABM0ZWX0_APLCA|nr:uncharacterized protein LOC106011367 [Aplysia californica]
MFPATNPAADISPIRQTDRRIEDEPPLSIILEVGRLQWAVRLKVPPHEHGSPLSGRHLAQWVECQLGPPAHKQQFMFKGFTWVPDMGVWSTSLRALGVKNGDRIQLVSTPPLSSDWRDCERLDTAGRQLQTYRQTLARLTNQWNLILHGFKVQTSAVVALTKLRKDFEDMKTKLRKEIQTLSSLTFDYRNCLCQARRRQLVDATQRQIDKCTDVSGAIFQRLSLSHSMSRVGRLYPVERSVRPVR